VKEATYFSGLSLDIPCLSKLEIEAIEQPLLGGNNSIYKAQAKSGQKYAVKKYCGLESTFNERLNREYKAFYFLSEHGVNTVPRAYGFDEETKIGVYDWIEGQRVTSVKTCHIDRLVLFLSQLKELSDRPEAKNLSLAKDACPCLADLFQLLDDRFDRLNTVSDEAVKHFVFRDCASVYGTLKKEAQEFNQSLDANALTLSPSDYGFHNALEKHDGKLCFIDFEYFGWDDPVKMVSDFLWHPGQQLAGNEKEYFKKKMECVFPGVSARFDALFPLYGLVWVLILLNNFIPSVWQEKVMTGVSSAGSKEAVCREQYEKARAMLSAVRKFSKGQI
jgi:thiamine kinase-like enzyme